MIAYNAIHADIRWALTDDGTLTISGTDMPNYNSAPWYSKRANIKKVVIANGVRNIGKNAFWGCSALTSVTIPNSVTSIGEYSFSGCIGLASITIPKSVTGIGEKAFGNCRALTSIIVEKDNSEYDSRNDCNAIIETKSNTLIKGCSKTIIPNSVTSIGVSAFQHCSDLTSIIIPESVTSIGSSAFWNCSGLTSIIIPESVTGIGYTAFLGCSGLTSIHIPNSVTSIGYGAFAACSGLTSIIVEEGNTKYDSRNNCNAIIEKESNTLITGCQNTNIPNSVTNIGDSAFYNCLTLTSITVPNSVVGIGTHAFRYCSSLTSITLPKSVTNIEYGAFDHCSGLTSIICEATTPSNCGDNSFCEVNKSIPIYVPNNSVVAYKNAKEWKEFTNIQAIIDNHSIANAVIEKIDAIGKVEYTDACKDKIDEANNAYNALTADQKALVTNLDVLTIAKQTYDNLKAAAEKLAADKAAANAVIAKINAIGKVEYTYACKDRIDEANNAYNALTADQKALVSNLDVLTIAKQTYDNLKAAADKLAADKTAFDKYKSEIIAIIESLLKEDDSDSVKDIINKATSDINAWEYDAAISLDDNKEKINSFVTSVNEAVENQRAEDQKTNGIDELELAEKVNIYDLNGRKITNSMLKSGLYIRNGKKVVVK